MKYYAVRSGNVFACVESEDEQAACIKALTQHIHETHRGENDPCAPGRIFVVAESGASTGNHVIILTEQILVAGGFDVSRDASE